MAGAAAKNNGHVEVDDEIATPSPPNPSLCRSIIDRLSVTERSARIQTETT